jgi:DNA-damage-inducible protein J
MSSAVAYVRARIDTDTKKRADERCLPFDVKAPSKSSREALAEIAAGKMKTFATVDDLMANLNADN